LPIGDWRLTIDGLPIERLTIDALSNADWWLPIDNQQSVDRQSTINNPSIGTRQSSIGNDFVGRQLFLR